MTLEIAGLGRVAQDGDWFKTEPRDVPVLGGPTRFIVDGYELGEDARDLVACVENFCALDDSALRAASAHVFAYYLDVARGVAEHEPNFPRISCPDEVWDFVRLTRDPLVQREQSGGSWFVALENECAWEPEHGLMLVLKEGRAVTKVSEYDGHLTNGHAFANDSIPENAVYWPMSGA